MGNHRTIVSSVFVFFLQAGSGLAADFSGPAVSVLDGDTIEVLHNSHPERIRLSGIDCPEKGQAYGQKARQAASALVFGKEVTLQTPRYRQVRAHPCRCLPARWDEHQSRTGQRRLVLVVSEVCPSRCRTGAPRKRSTRSKERIVG